MCPLNCMVNTDTSDVVVLCLYVQQAMGGSWWFGQPLVVQ